jgi:hypothetical protein
VRIWKWFAGGRWKGDRVTGHAARALPSPTGVKLTSPSLLLLSTSALLMDLRSLSSSALALSSEALALSASSCLCLLCSGHAYICAQSIQHTLAEVEEFLQLHVARSA